MPEVLWRDLSAVKDEDGTLYIVPTRRANTETLHGLRESAIIVIDRNNNVVKTRI